MKRISNRLLGAYLSVYAFFMWIAEFKSLFLSTEESSREWKLMKISFAMFLSGDDTQFVAFKNSSRYRWRTDKRDAIMGGIVLIIGLGILVTLI